MKHLQNNKKGMAIGTIFKAVLAIVVLLLLIMIFFAGEDSQFGQIRKALPTISSIIKPDGYSNSDSSYDDKETASKILFGEFVEGISVLSNDAACQNAFYFLEPNLDYSSIGEGMWIRIDSQTPGMTVKLEVIEKVFEKELKKTKKYSTTLPPKAQDSSSLTPCIIIGDSAKSFAESSCMNYVNNLNNKYSSSFSYSCEPFNQLIIKEDIIYLDGEDIGISFNSKEYQLSMMRLANNKLAFFITDSAIGKKCRVATLGKVGDKDLLSTDCFVKDAIDYYKGICAYTYYDRNQKTCI